MAPDKSAHFVAYCSEERSRVSSLLRNSCKDLRTMRRMDNA